VFALCRHRGADARTSALATLASFLLAWSHLAMRPQLLGALFFAVTLALTLTREAGQRRMWLVLVVTFVWVNSHGSFVLAPVIVGVALVADLRSRRGHGWRLLPVLGATVAATLLNPWGPRVWVYVWSLSMNDTIRTTVTEWAPTSFSTASGAMFLVALIGIIVWFGLRRESVPAGALALVGACSLFALMASRNVLWWALVVPPMLSGLVPEAGVSRSVRGGSTALNRALLGVLAVAVLVAMPWWRPSAHLVSGLPSNDVLAAVDRAVPNQTRLFVYQPWASWFEFSRPDLEPFVDSRIELFDRSLWDEYDLVIDGSDGWRETLARHGIDAVLVSARETTLISQLRGDPAWRSIVSDGSAALFVRV